MKKIIALISIVFTAFVSNAQCVTTISGNGIAGFANGTGTSSTQLKSPSGLVVNSSGNIFVADTNNNNIRNLNPFANVYIISGPFAGGYSQQAGYLDGGTGYSKFYYPFGLCIDLAGNIYVADSGNHLIRKISPSGFATKLAGTGTSSSTGFGVPGYADGVGGSAKSA